MEKLKQWIAESNRIVFFGGAGVSTESGIPDFRSVDGLYSQKFDYPPEINNTHNMHNSYNKRLPPFQRLPFLDEPSSLGKEGGWS